MPPSQNHTDTVLVIDDDQVSLELMTRSLSREGVGVTTAMSGEEGLRLAREVRPLAIFLDVVMPNMDGWAVLAALKADPELAEIPVFMVTMMDEKKKGLALGVADYLIKPVHRNRLAAVLQQLHPPQPPQQPETPATPPPPAGPRPVLIVEDDPTNREILGRLLRRQGLTVVEAENGKTALQRVQEIRPGLIVLDLMLPVMDGLTFVQIRKSAEFRSIPIVVLTAKDLTANDRLRLGDSVRKVLQKGAYKRDELLREINA